MYLPCLPFLKLAREALSHNSLTPPYVRCLRLKCIAVIQVRDSFDGAFVIPSA